MTAMTLFFLGFGTQVSLAQETTKGKVSPSPTNTTTTPAAKIEYTSPVISFLYFKKLTQPLQPEARIKMMNEILNIIKKEENKRVPDLKSITQEDPLSLEYYEVSGDLSGRRLTMQHIPKVEKKNAGNISLSWNEKDERGTFQELVCVSFSRWRSRDRFRLKERKDDDVRW